MSGIYIPVPSMRKLACASVDIVIVVGSLFLALLIRFGVHTQSITGYEGLYAKTVLLTLTLVLCFYYNDLYVERAPHTRRELLLQVLQSFVAAGILLSILYYAVPYLELGRGLIFLQFTLCMTAFLLWRATYYWALRRGSLNENVVVIGTGDAAKEIAREMLNRKHQGYRVLGFLSDDPMEVGVKLVNPSVIGTFDDLCAVVDEQRVDMVVVALEDRRGRLPVNELLRCKVEGIKVEEAPSFYEMLTGQIPVRNLRPSWLIFSQGFRKSPLLQNTKRVAEFLAASVCVVIALPVLILSSLLVWLESGRPILYRQERVGQKGDTFTLYKLRTMKQDAEKETGPVWASADGDPRITRVGRFLRKSRFDELPQLFNVLKGEMSFVGPRPERPWFVDGLRKSIPYYDERHSVKPGITGWAQVRLGYGASVEEMEAKLRYDLYYIKHMSPWLDLMIVLDTVKVILFGRGAR
jgi:sugar transferase (PEP-CTERM system associated)